MTLFKQSFDVNPFPVYIKDEQGKFVFVNKAYADIQGLDITALLKSGKSEFDYSSERDLEVLHTGKQITIQEFYKSENGKLHWYNTIKKPFKQPDGFSYLLSISSDITELKEIILDETDASESKEHIFTHLCKGIRTPVYSIIEIAKLIKRKDLSKDQEEKINTILSITDNILATLNQTLDYAALDMGNDIELELVHFNPALVLQDTTNVLLSKAREQDLTLELKITQDLPPLVQGDPFRLSQILLILINNAIKYTKRGRVTVSIRLKEQTRDRIQFEFCVEDTGIGISEEKAIKILGESSSRHSDVGHCIGLSICKRLVELQGGMLWLDSIPGFGSRFYFSIPYLISEMNTESFYSEPLEVPHTLKGVHILLTEDNQVNQLIAITQLESWDVLVEIAFDGAEALKKIQDKKYDLILMDIQMPNMDGIEVTSYVRNKVNPNQDTPIIAFTANTDKRDAKRYKSYGFTDCLFKPYHQAELYKIIVFNTGRTSVLSAELPSLSGTDNNKLYDFSGLGSLAQDVAFIQRMQRLFIETVPGQLKEIKDAIKQEDWEAVAQMAHRLKSTYGNIKMREAAEIMKNIEQLAHSKSYTDQINNLVHKVFELTDHVLIAFSAELHNDRP